METGTPMGTGSSRRVYWFSIHTSPLPPPCLRSPSQLLALWHFRERSLQVRASPRCQSCCGRRWRHRPLNRCAARRNRWRVAFRWRLDGRGAHPDIPRRPMGHSVRRLRRIARNSPCRMPSARVRCGNWYDGHACGDGRERSDVALAVAMLRQRDFTHRLHSG